MNNAYEMISNEELESLKDSFCTILSFIILKRNGLLPKAFEIDSKDTNSSEENTYTQKQLLSKQEVLEKYPMFTETALNRAVKFQGLEYVKVGRSRYFDTESIENWFESKKQKETYNRFEEIQF